MDPKQLKKHIEYIHTDMGMFSASSVDISMLTCAQESKMGYYVEQLGGGTAKGIFQMEPGTHDFLWRYIKRKGDDFEQRTIAPYMITDPFGPTKNQTLNIAYQIAMARLNYWRIPAQLPVREEFETRDAYIWELAKYWKKYWNTHRGKGTVEEAFNNYQKYVEGKA